MKTILKSILIAISMLITIAANATHLIVPVNTTYMVGTSAPYNTLHGGDTLLLTHGTWGYIYLKNFTGTSVAPIVIMNYGGVVTCGRNFTYGIKIGGCRYIKFTGTGSSDKYGFHVTHPSGDGVSEDEMSSDIETCNVRMDSCGLRGIVSKTDPACGGYAYRSNFTQYNTVIHDCLINHTVNEGMYIGNTHYTGWDVTCNGNDSLLMPSILNGVQIYNMIVMYAGYDGIQVSSSLNASIHNNFVDYDSQSNTYAQRSGILIGGGTQGDCYDNYIENGNGDGIENFGLGNYKVYNNVIKNAGINYYPGNTSYPCYGIYTNDNSVIQGNYYYFMFNTIINPKTSGIDFASQKATTSVIADNCIINPNGSYILNNGYSGITITNNYTNTNILTAMFKDTTYMTNNGSPLINTGWVSTEGINLDKFGNNRFQGSSPDIGVYEFSLDTTMTLIIVTDTVTNITQTTATSGGVITSNKTITARGVCWSTTMIPTITNNHTIDGSGTGAFVSNITGLTNGITYYVRAYATTSSGTSYGGQMSFTTITIPSITTDTITSITQTTATSGGVITSNGGVSVTAKGVCWSTTTSPTITNSFTNNGSGNGVFVSNITGLTSNTLYYVRAYATNINGTAYGNQRSFTTTTTLPTITTTTITLITQTTATSGGNITSSGGSTVTARGVCWNTTTNPTISNSKTSDGTGTGSYVSNITGLTSNTLYYVRAYATNINGTAYGSQLSFTTTTTTTLPTLTTTTITLITQTTATSGGNITSSGGSTVTARGVCWNTGGFPDINNSHTSDGSGTGSYTSNITGLSGGTIYYVRAYATNTNGTAYGNQRSFTTTPFTLANVTTNTITNVTNTTATCGGNVTSSGGTTVTARGVCWSKTVYPTTNNPHTSDGTGTGNFISYITGLTRHTSYYVRAYATNTNGTAYGNQRYVMTTGSSYDINGIDDTITSVESNIVKLYPNPVTGTLTIEINLIDKSDVNILVYDIKGTKVYNEQINDQPFGVLKRQLNTSLYVDGDYIVITIINNSVKIIKKFIKIS